MNAEKVNKLYEVKDRNNYRVVSLPALQLLENIGLRVGTIVVVLNRYAFGGPLVLRVADAYTIALGKDLALQIVVEVET